MKFDDQINGRPSDTYAHQRRIDNSLCLGVKGEGRSIGEVFHSVR
jgi:hypothetical protein